MFFAITKDLTTGKNIHNSLNSLMVLHNTDPLNDALYLINDAFCLYDHILYKVKNIDGFFDKELTTGWLAIRFSDPKHMIIMNSQKDYNLFQEWFYDPLLVCIQRNCNMTILERECNINFSDFLSAERYDRYTMDIGCLSTIILEGVDLPYLPENLGHTPISYLSISSSKLELLDYEPETFWDWMSKSTICNTLKVLEMNSNDLEELPFEIVFLKELTALSVSRNNLTCIPHSINELQKLNILFIDNNKIQYLPQCLQLRTFESMNISGNDFEPFHKEFLEKKKKKVLRNQTEGSSELKVFDERISFLYNCSPRNHSKSTLKRTPCLNLSHLSLFCLIDNHVQFKRQDLYRNAVKYLNMLYRCSCCHKLMIAEKDDLYTENFPRSKNFISTGIINWQYFKCNYNCFDFDNAFRNL